MPAPDKANLTKAQAAKLQRFESALDKLDALLFRLGQQGLQRMSRSSVSELKAIQQTAHNASMIAAERQLEVLATQVERYLDRDPLFRVGDVMHTLNRLWLLNRAARRRYFEHGQTPPEMLDLLGEARRSYEDVSEALIVQAIGASGWVTDTSFVGITVYLASRTESGVVYQASNAKPTMYFGSDPRMLLRQSISDYLNQTIQDFAHGAFRMEHAKRSRDGRLSLHKHLKVYDAPFVGAKAYESLTARRWTELVDRMRAQEVSPLSGAGSLLACIEPAAWGSLSVDVKRARASALVFDASKAALVLEVALREENNFLVDNLELMLGANRAFPLPQALFGRVFIGGGRLRMAPYSAIYHEAQLLASGKRVHEVHLSLEQLRKGRR